ncbi:MAG TPA: serine hydrolase domain-containing protein [Vicinamibacterales bacterium]|nr:serine hydrolase domain-containing protein [Vicinamibacterales bacterium]
MSLPNRRTAEVVLAALFTLGLLIVGGGALYFVSTINPVHTDPAAVPSSGAEPQERYAGSVAEARTLARDLLVKENLPGLSIAVAKDGDVVWAEGFGYANAERRATVTPRTRFRTGSVSKTMTAAAIAMLYERGRIDLDAPVQRYVPRYPEKQWMVTTRQLLGDVAGVHRIRGDNNDNVPRGHCTDVNESVEIFAGEPLLFEPGTQYRFSTYGWILLSAAIEGASGESFPSFMKREVFTPLGMDRTVLEGAEDDGDMVSFYFPRAAMRVNLGLQDAPEADYSCFAGAGAFLSTPSDLVRLGSAMLRPGVLKADTIALFETPVHVKSGESSGFALGWKVDEVQLAGTSVRVVRHRANLIGGNVSLTLIPDRGLAVAVMSNVSHTDVIDPFAQQVAAALVGDGRF